MRIIRSAIVVAAVFVAACGDKVTVPAAVTTIPTTVAPKVNSVSVAPTIATMNIGDAITLTAAVNADVGLATTVTWASSDQTKASVTAAGVVTAVAATPGVAICATSTVDTGKKGCATVVVAAAAIPAANGVTVTPAAATIGVGGSITLTSVTAGTAGISQAVTWSSADTTKAKVTAAGVVTGVAATGGVSICAASTVAGSTAKGCAAIVVTAAPVASANSVTVTPSAVTLQMVAGATQPTVQLNASVSLSNSTNTAVTWTTGDATKATVSATGLVTAVGAGAVSVCAASAVTATVQGCASITIAAYVAPAPASVSIQSITLGGNLNTPVNNAAVVGAVNVSMNVIAGGQTITKVALTVNGTEVDAQTFSSAQAAALRAASDAAVATQAAPQTIVFYVNTAAYNTTTGAPAYANGTMVIGANLYTVAGGSTTKANSASNATSVTFANVDGFAVTMTPNIAVTAGAVDANGYRWFGNGTLTINAVPVMYSGKAVGTVSAALGAGTTPANCPALGVASTASTLTGSAYAVTLTLASLQSTTGANSCQQTPQLPTVTATDANGANLTLGGTNGVLNTQTGIRWDNVGPTAPAFTANPNGRSNGWINDAVSFNTIVATANPNGWLAGAVTDAGVGGAVTYSVQTALNTGGLVDKARTGTAATSSAALAQTAVAAGVTAYCAIARSADQLGNLSAMPLAGANCASTPGSTIFGVDRVAPIVTLTTTLGNGKSLRMFNTGTPNYSYSLSDTSLNAAAANISVKTTAIRYSGATAADTQSVTTVVAPPTTTLTQAHPVAAVSGYWTVSATASDQAGNSASITPYIYLYDASAASASNPLQTNAGLTAGNAESFFATVTDNVDLDSAYVVHSYNTLAAGTNVVYPFIVNMSKLQASPFTVAAPVKTTTFTGTWTNGLPRSVGQITSGAAISTGVADLGVFGTGLTFWPTDQTNGGTGTLDVGSTANTAASVAYAAVNGPTASAWAGLTTTASVTIAKKRTTLNQASGAGKIISDTITVTLSQSMVTPPTSNPFSRAELWIRTNSGTATGAAVATSRGLQLLSSVTPVVAYDGQAQIAQQVGGKFDITFFGAEEFVQAVIGLHGADMPAVAEIRRAAL